MQDAWPAALQLLDPAPTPMVAWPADRTRLVRPLTDGEEVKWTPPPRKRLTAYPWQRRSDVTPESVLALVLTGHHTVSAISVALRADDKLVKGRLFMLVDSGRVHRVLMRWHVLELVGPVQQ